MDLRAAIEGSKYRVRGKKLTWTGTVKPTPMSKPYTLRIAFRIGREKTPTVEVASPELILSEGKSVLPHCYSEGGLCLFQPKYNEWNERMPMAETILPWAMEWLHFYEIWLVTGEWLGGGEDHLAKTA
jgi:hypothetical protein